MTDKHETSSAAVARGGKYLTFALGNEEYGLQILKVREIIGCLDITAVPRTPSHIKGVMNLRGQVISVMDLRAKFGMESVPKTEQTCIIVVETSRGGRKLNTGVLVDRVSEVLNIDGERIEDTPTFDSSVQTDFILGIAKIGDAVKILLDIEKLIAPADVLQVNARAA